MYLEAASAGERGTSEQHDVECYTETPHVTPLIVSALVPHEQINHFGGHELSRADRGVH